MGVAIVICLPIRQVRVRQISLEVFGKNSSGLGCIVFV
jgi:hypothetical protein